MSFVLGCSVTTLPTSCGTLKPLPPSPVTGFGGVYTSAPLNLLVGAVFSVQLSGIIHGRRHLLLWLAAAATAVAVALTPWDEMFNNFPKIVGNGVLRNSPLRYTSTRTHEPVTPEGHAHDTCAVGAVIHTLLARAAPIALLNALPLLAGGFVSSS